MSKLAKDISIDPDKYQSVPSENITKDGRTVWVTWTNKGIFDEQGNVKEILAVGNDITEQKVAEQLIRESDEKTRLILDSAAEAIYGLDHLGNCTFANNSCLKMLGYKSENDLLGRNMHELIHHTAEDGSPSPAEQSRNSTASRHRNSTTR